MCIYTQSNTTNTMMVPFTRCNLSRTFNRYCVSSYLTAVFFQGSLNDITCASIDASESNNPSPEATGYPSPSKSSVCMLEAGLVEVDEQCCDRLSNPHATINGGSSPRTDPNCSPSPCHSTYGRLQLFIALIKLIKVEVKSVM